MGFPREPRDTTSHKFPLTIDPRLDSRIWTDACRKERRQQMRGPPPDRKAEQTTDEVGELRQLTERLEGISADYLWRTEQVPGSVDVAPRKQQPEVSAMAELCMGIGDAETSFLRGPSGIDSLGGKPRRAYTEQVPSMAP